MIARLALLFVLVPLLELMLLIQLGQWVGLWPTIGLVVFTGLTGAALARAQGLRTLFAFQEATAQGRLPAREIQDGLAILVGGALLMTPGLITDLAGFFLLVPFSRRWIQARLRAAFLKRVQEGRIQVAVFGAGPFASPGPFSHRGYEAPARQGSSPVQEARIIDVESEEPDG